VKCSFSIVESGIPEYMYPRFSTALIRRASIEDFLLAIDWQSLLILLAVLYIMLCLVGYCRRLILGEEKVHETTSQVRRTNSIHEIVPKKASPYALYRCSSEEFKRIGERCTKYEVQKLVQYLLSLHLQKAKKQPL